MNILEMSPDDLIPYENNPRDNDSAVDAVAASIREFGFRVPIIIDKDNVIVAGHTRLKAAQALGLTSVPVIRADDLSEEQAREFRILDNKSSEYAEWNLDMMKKELEEISGIDMSEFGFMIEEIEKEKKKTDREPKEATEICCPRCGRVVAIA